MRVHLLAPPDPEHRSLLDRRLAPGIDVTAGADLPDPPEVDILVGGRPSAEQLDASPDLAAVVIPYAGLPAGTREKLLARPALRVYNLHHNAAVTAEMAVALLLAAAKQVVPMDQALRRGCWSGRGRDNPAVLLDGRTALVLGFGAIGRRVARAVAALGMTPVAVRRRAGAETVEDGVAVHPAAALPSLLPGAAAVVVCVPLTEETRGLLGEDELAALPRETVLVNVARGPVVEERALYEALRDGRLHSAGLDVWYRYPGRDGDPDDTPPSAYPFGELPNVVLSPHRGGWLEAAEARRMEHLAALLNALAAGGNPEGRVDVAAGY